MLHKQKIDQLASSFASLISSTVQLASVNSAYSTIYTNTDMQLQFSSPGAI